MERLQKEFIAEGREALDRMEQCLTALEVRPGDPEIVAEIFRAVHTIKGSTGFLGFRRLELLAHAGESLLGALRSGRLTVTAELITLLLALLDRLRQILRLIEATGSEGIRAEDQDDALLETLRAPVLPAPAKTTGADTANVRPPEPQPVAITAERFREPQVDAAFSGLDSSADKTIRIDVDVLDRMVNLVSELVLTRNQLLQATAEASAFEQLGRRLDAVTTDLRDTVMQARMQPVGNLFGKFPRMVRDLAKICERMARIEVSGHETGLDRSLLEAIRDPLTHAIRNAIDHGIEPPVTRMKFGKPVVGLISLRASQHGGTVIIEISDDGAGIAVDKVLAKAIEQGITTPERARAMTERDVLQMIFRPGFSTAEAVTHLSGRGVGLDVVRSNLEKVGGSVEVESQPGKGTMFRLRVPLTVAIIPALIVLSRGQTFALPRSAVSELVYVSPEDAPQALEPVGAAEIYRLRDDLLPVLRLDRMLGIEATALHTDVQGTNRAFHLAVLESEGSRFGLLLDDLLAPEEIVVKPLSKTLREIGLFSGATVLGNGSLTLILDLPALAARAGDGLALEQAPAKPVSEAAPVEDEQRFLVFDEGRDNGIAIERTAIPLESVERIESVPFQAIEYAGGEALLQYLGETLTLADGGGVLKARFAARHQETCPDSEVTVLICTRPAPAGVEDRRMGVVVRHVFDVASGSLLAPAGQGDERRLALVDSRLSTIHQQFAETMRWPEKAVSA